MADAQPLTVFSRDLKYMLDDRQAAAPLRRSALLIRIITVFVLVTVGTWSGIRLLPDDEEQTVDAGTHYVRTAPAASHLSTRQPEYTQVKHSVTKPVGSIHPDIEYQELASQSNWQKPDIEWQSYRVRRGDTLGKIFKHFSLDVGLASRIATHEHGAMLKKLLPGRNIRFGFDDGNELITLRYELDRLKEMAVDFERQGEFKVSERNIPVETRERKASRVIGSSLFVSASSAGLSDRVIMDLVSIFGWEIDFALDIRSGDRFSIIYEELLVNGEPFGTGDIVAAEFFNQGKIYRAIRHIDDNGNKEYFDLDGNNLRGTFLKTPMRVSRITSGFSKRRYHPVLKKWRAHRGVDYGAPPGTPVLATGDGRVNFLGRKGGYGNTVVLKHGGQYSTLYAHLSGYQRGLKRGAVIHQGDVIGYVGSTGLVTGPHLHYEFRVNGKHRDPLSYETPKAEPIAAKYRDSFLAMAQDRVEQIAEIRPEQIASR